MHRLLNKMNDAVRDLFEELNRPSAARLKTALTELGLDTSGLKAVLKARLLEAL